MTHGRSRGGTERQRQSPWLRLSAVLAIVALFVMACGGGGTSPGASRAPSAAGSAPASVAAPSASAEESDAPSASAEESAGEPSASAEETAGEPSASAEETAGVSPGEPTLEPTPPQPTPVESLAAGGPDIATTIQPPGTGGPITVWNHFTGPDGAYFAALVERFNAETPQCQTQVFTQSGAQWRQRLEAATVANQLPHVLAGGYDQIPLLAENGIIAPIDDLAEQAGLGPDRFPEAIWNAGVWKEARYGIPLDTHPMVFFYNKALFTEAGLDPESPPADQASFEAAITAINDNTEASGYQQVGSGPGGNFLAGLAFATLFYQAGGQWTNEDYSQATFNSDAGIRAAEYLAHLVNDLDVPIVVSDEEIIAFASGENGMVWSGIWESTRYREALGEDLGVAPVPQIFGPGVWGGSHQLQVTTAAAEADAETKGCAYYFVDWLSANSYNWAEGGQVPARNEVREAIITADAPEGTLGVIKQAAPMAETVQFLPTVPGGGDLLFAAQGAGEATTLVVNGTQTAAEALNAAAEFNTGILQQNKLDFGF